MTTLICMDGTVVENYDRNEAAAKPPTPTPHRHATILRYYNEMVAEDHEEFGEHGVGSLYAALAWDKMAAKLHTVAAALTGQNQVAITDRAKYCMARADVLRLAAKNARLMGAG